MLPNTPGAGNFAELDWPSDGVQLALLISLITVTPD
jgi:hypothetical protein